MVEFPDALFERLRSGDVVLCSGVRFAATAGMPSWDDLLAKLSEKIGGDSEGLRPVISAGDLLTAAGYLKRKLGADTFGSMLREAYGNGASPSAAHRLLAAIPWHAALSTGYDSLVEKSLSTVSPKIYSYADGAVLRLAEDLEHFVIKAHGDVAHPDKTVLTRLDYKRLIGPNHAYRAFVEDLYRTRTMLLVGYRLSDPDFQLFLDRLVGTFRDAVSDHYAIMPRVSEPEAEELYANYRLRVIPYDDNGDAVAALTHVIEEFQKAWRESSAGVEDVDDPAAWLKRNLGPVEARIDVVAGEGLSIPEGRLARIRDTAAGIDLALLDPATLLRLGNVRLYLGDSGGAVQCFEAALAQDKDLADAHLNLHHAHAETKDFGKALEHLKRATDLDDSMRVVPKRYDLSAVIGRGTTGTVYQAKDKEDGDKDVTVKVLRTSYVREHVSPERWLKETEVLTGLEHPNVARVYRALVEGGRCVLVTESLNGHSLARELREGSALTPDRAAEIISQVCEGLAYAHEQDVLHLDIMPSNIFLRDDGSVALMDFRSGRAQKGRHVTVKKGSEGFQAPELLAGAGADQRADVYSLGATLYYMLTKRAPLGSFPRLSEANPAARRFESIVMRALRAVPEERPQSVGEFIKVVVGSGEEVTLPDRDDDLIGWLEVLSFQPENERALEALEKLESQARDDKDWDTLVTMLLGRVEIEPEGEKRHEMLREVARIFEMEVGDLGKAFAALQAAFREAHNSVEIRKDLERLAGATGMWNELLQEYTTLVQSLRDPKVAGDWWVRMGQLYANELGHDDYAAAAFGQALALDANRTDALSELAEVVKRKGDHKEVARLLSRQAQLEENHARKVELYKDLAHTYAKDLGSDEQAMLAYRKILEIDPVNQHATQSLDSLYRKNEMWEELAEMLRDRLGHAEAHDHAAQLRLRRSLAEVLAEHSGKAEEAIEQYERILQLDADDTAALKGLERLYDATGRNEEYLRILDQRIEAAESEAEKVALYRRLAAEWEEQAGGKSRAAEYLEKAVALAGGGEDLYKALIRLYWELKAYDKLADAYAAQARVTEAPDERAILYAALGRVLEEHLEDIPRAIESYNNVLTVDADSKIALEALARLYEKTSVWAQAVEMYERLSTKEEDVDKQVECFYQMGRLQGEQLERLEDAEGNLVKALELKDDHVPTLVSLARLNRKRKDYGKAARLMREAARNTANELERVERFFDAGTTYQDDLFDEERAREVYVELMEIDPEHVAAGQRLSAIYEKQGELDKALPMLEMLVRKSSTTGSKGDRKRAIDLNLRLGDAYMQAERRADAIVAYRRAYELDPTNSTALGNLAEQLFESGEHEEAGKLYQALLVHRRDTMETSDIVRVFTRLGEVKEAMGEHTKALNMYEKALDVDPNDPTVLARLVHAYEEKGDFDAVLRAQRGRLKSITNDKERFALLEEMGDLLVKQLGRSKEGVQYYQQALEVEPDQRRVLHKTMEAFIEHKSWEEALRVLRRLEELETDPVHKYRLHYTAALILRDTLGKPKQAARHFDLALENDPTNVKAFNALKTLFTAQGNFEGLVKAYRRMLKRLPESTPVAEQVRLWHELGTICETQLRDARGAIVAFEVAAKLDPSNVERQEKLSRLYVSAGPSAYEKAIRANQRLLQGDPMRLEAYKELRRLYAELGQMDKAWCVTAVLTLLKRASNEEAALYQKLKPDEMRRVTRKLDEQVWRDCVTHEKQHPVLSELFNAIVPVVGPMALRPRHAYGLKAGEQLNPQEDTRAYARAYDYASRVIGQQADELHLRGDVKEKVAPVIAGDVNKRDVLLWVAPMLLDERRTQPELTFWFTRALALLRRENLLAFITPSSNVLQAFALAALRLVRPKTRIRGDVEEIEQLVAVLRSDLPARHVEMIASHADELGEASATPVIDEWLAGVDLTATRAALLLCDDLPTAARLVIDDPRAGGMNPKARLAQMLAYSVSEQFFEARATLGLSVA
ncbi:MAG: tetratricopeptide repeat protein [Myxococcales bacterium]|nr:tetratricopeptide repeat protein [Myxococcales bacterium]